MTYIWKEIHFWNLFSWVKSWGCRFIAVRWKIKDKSRFRYLELSRDTNHWFARYILSECFSNSVLCFISQVLGSMFLIQAFYWGLHWKVVFCFIHTFLYPFLEDGCTHWYTFCFSLSLPPPSPSLPPLSSFLPPSPPPSLSFL